jgi:rubrerythrin
MKKGGTIVTEKTNNNLAYAFAAESAAAARNEAFAKKAEKENYPQLARLFRALAAAETVHANKYLLILRGKVGSSEENLKYAFENDINANEDEYMRLVQDAIDEGFGGAEKFFSQSKEVASIHAELYEKASETLLKDKYQKYFVCNICGFIIEDEAPEKCPICGAVKTRFKSVI